MKRIHVVGVSTRSGTTLLAECLRECFEIDAYEDHEARLSKLRWGASIYLTKNPGDLARVHSRLRLDPRLTVICMMRDPRDVIVSTHAKDRSVYHASLDVWKRNADILDRYEGRERFHIIRYEDLISDPDTVQALLISKINYLKPVRQFSNWSNGSSVSSRSARALNGARALDAANTGRWLKDKARIAQQIRQHGSISDELIKWGYEPDNRWLELLDMDPQGRTIAKDNIKPISFKKQLLWAKRDWIDYPVSSLVAAACNKLAINYG